MLEDNKTGGQLRGELGNLRKRIAELEASETRLKQVEKELQVSEGKYRSLVDDVLDSSHVGIIVRNVNFKIVWVNQSLECYFGLHRGEILGKDIRWLIRERLKHIVEEPKQFMERELATFKNGSQTGRFECHVLANNEREEWWLEHWAQLIHSGLYAGGVVEYYTDITGRKKAEEALRQSELKYSTLIEKGNDGVIVIQDGLLKFVNSKMIEVTGLPLAEALGKPFADFVSQEHKQLVAGIYKRMMSGQLTANNYEIEIVSKDGRKIPVEINANVIEYESKPADMAIIRDISERKQSEDALQQSEEKLRHIFESARSGILVMDLNGKIVQLNEAGVRTLGYSSKEELIGQNTFDLIAEGDRALTMDRMIGTVSEIGKSVEYTCWTKNGREFPASISTGMLRDHSGSPSGLIIIFEDITERKKMQEQLILTDHLASIGELASGIAHELNNPLTGVIGFSQLVLERDVPDNIRKDIEIIYREAQRAAETVKHLLTFARKHAPTRQLVNVNDSIEKVLVLREYEQKVSNIKAVRRFTDLPEIMADYFQLQQVFLNIIINAEYFMIEAHGKGVLTIATDRVGGSVRISFADDGPGITRGNLKHILDPFFTTKPPGKGTGLGLSICYGIVTAHGGRIYAESQIGRGATFFVELPIGTQTEELNK